MRISIFPQANPHPKTKEEKKQEAFKVSKPYQPKVVDIKDENDLIETICSNAWSPSIFSGYRHNDNFLSTDFMVLDIDSGLTIQETEKRCEKLGLCHLILPSPSFTPENHRFRLIFPLVETISDKECFDATWQYLGNEFPEIDKQCSDYARFYFGSNLADGVFGEGEFLKPIKPQEIYAKYDQEISANVELKDYSDLSIFEILYGKVPKMLPEGVDYFLKHAHTGMEGEWICSLNRAVFTLALQGVEESAIITVVEKLAPHSLDNKDLDCIRRALKDGQDARADYSSKLENF